MKVEDYFIQGRRSWVRLYEKGGKQHEVAHHNLDAYIEAYIKGCGAQWRSEGFLVLNGCGEDWAAHAPPVEPVGCLPDDPQASESRRETKIGNHTFRATGITAYLKNGRKLEIAQQIAAHESSRTPGCMTAATMM